jgi:hypothetical protein
LLAVIACSMFASSSVMAQRFQPFGPMEDFGHDLQMFAPAEVSSFGGGPEPNTGYFVAYDRVNWSVSRALHSSQPNEMDWTWGNRLDLGYMTNDEHGWLVEILHISGPNNPNIAIDFSQNPPVAGPRFIENSMDFTSVELMKQWRFKQLHHGSYVDAFIGARYGHMMHEDNLVRDLGFAITNGLAIESQMIGPQAGLRWFKQKGRWTLSSEGRYFYAWNHQVFASAQFRDMNGIPLLGGFPSEERWVHAGDVRAEITYDLSKSFAIATGIDVLYLANGVARGFPPANDQDALFIGWTFGIKINR